MKRLIALACLCIISTLPASPSRAADRIVIAGGVATEIAYLLGGAARIAGVDDTATYPAQANELPRIGYFRRLSAEGVLSLSPDLVLASPSAGPPLALQQIEAAGITVSVLPEVTGLDDVAPKIRAVGAAFGLEDKASELAETFAGQVSDIRANRPTGPAPRVMFVLTIRDAAPLVVGRGTTTDEVLREAGAVNAADFHGYKPMNREAVIAAAPDLVLMTEEHSQPPGTASDLLARPEFQATPAGAANRLLKLPALAILGLGPRTPEAIRQLRAAFP